MMEFSDKSIGSLILAKFPSFFSVRFVCGGIK